MRRIWRARAWLGLVAAGTAGCQIFLALDDHERVDDAGAPDAATVDAVADVSPADVAPAVDAGPRTFGPVEDVATGIADLRALVVDDDAVYFIGGIADSGGDNGSVVRLQKDGAASRPFEAPTQFGDPVAIAQDKSRVYVAANFGGGGNYQRVHRFEKAGGPAGSVQVQVNSGLIDVVIASGDAITCGQGPGDGWISATPSDLWSFPNTRSIADDTADGVRTVWHIAADRDFVYAATARGIIRVENAPTGKQITFFSDPGHIAGAIVLAAGVVYWIDGGNIARLATSEIGKPRTDLVVGTNDLRALAVRGDDLFWADATRHEIRRASALDGGGAAAVATGQDTPVSVAVDDAGAVYWAEHTSGAVRRVRLQ